ncbi:ATP-grasp domain-containing protein [Promicromonospora sp. NPDC057138]|uniref:ATP-grasp domain-containing protein n=1 Tax=Promicromonospora sp. NPDC057138 TaxID=3346031 RepID=UPI00363D10FC
MTSLLVTGAGGPAGRALGAQLAARAAAGADLTWVGVDIAPVTDPHFPATDRAPRADGWDYATGMRDLIDKHAPDLVIPTVQDELPQVAVLAQALGGAAPGGRAMVGRAATADADGAPGPAGAVVTAAPGSAAIAADKLLTMLALDRSGVPVPRYALVTDFASAREALAWARGPIVVKPRVSRGGRGVQLIESPADAPDAAAWGRLDASWIVQSFAGGTEYNPQVHRSPSGETHVVVLEKTVLKQGRVGNAAAVVRLAEHSVPDVEETARRAVDALELVGPVDLDVRRDGTGKPVVLEVNGRFGANCAHAPELLDAVLARWATSEPVALRRTERRRERTTQPEGRPST